MATQFPIACWFWLILLVCFWGGKAKETWKWLRLVMQTHGVCVCVWVCARCSYVNPSPRIGTGVKDNYSNRILIIIVIIICLLFIVHFNKEIWIIINKKSGRQLGIVPHLNHCAARLLFCGFIVNLIGLLFSRYSIAAGCHNRWITAWISTNSLRCTVKFLVFLLFLTGIYSFIGAVNGDGDLCRRLPRSEAFDY